MPASGEVPQEVVLDLDPRTTVDPGERVYFRDKCAFGQKDYTILEGAVESASPEQYRVMLDRDIAPQSQSGSPVISQTTGKVIGIVSSIGDSGGDAMTALFSRGKPPRSLVLTPSSALLKALEQSERPLLSDVIGMKAGSPAQAQDGARPQQ